MAAWGDASGGGPGLSNFPKMLDNIHYVVSQSKSYSALIACQGEYYATAATSSEKTSKHTFVQCSRCPVGKSTKSESASYIGNVGIVSCKNCSAGNFRNNSMIGCQKCSSGYIASKEGSEICKKCEPGKVSSFDRTFCTACVAGMYLGLGNNCNDCEVGKYANVPGLPACKSCEYGTFQNVTGSTSCSNCSIGLFQDERAATFCKVCDMILLGSDNTAERESVGIVLIALDILFFIGSIAATVMTIYLLWDKIKRINEDRSDETAKNKVHPVTKNFSDSIEGRINVSVRRAGEVDKKNVRV